MSTPLAELRFGVADSDVSGHERWAEKIGDLDGLVERVEVLPDRVLAYTADGDEVIAKVHERGLTPVSVLVRRSTLEDVFLRLTGRSLID